LTKDANHRAQGSRKVVKTVEVVKVVKTVEVVKVVQIVEIVEIVEVCTAANKGRWYTPSPSPVKGRILAQYIITRQKHTSPLLRARRG
jgi:hypothetical protein